MSLKSLETSPQAQPGEGAKEAHMEKRVLRTENLFHYCQRLVIETVSVLLNNESVGCPGSKVL